MENNKSAGGIVIADSDYFDYLIDKAQQKLCIPSDKKCSPYNYGSSGWTLRSGVTKIILPFADLKSALHIANFMREPAEKSSRVEELPNYLDFMHIYGSQARALLTALPTQNLDDRHNGAPSTRRMLKAAYTSTTSIGGYLISPPRPDERVSIDSLCHFARPAIPISISGLEWSEVKDHKTWRLLRDYLDLGDCEYPDEFFTLYDEFGEVCGWRAWWD